MAAGNETRILRLSNFSGTPDTSIPDLVLIGYLSTSALTPSKITMQELLAYISKNLTNTAVSVQASPARSALGLGQDRNISTMSEGKLWDVYPVNSGVFRFTSPDPDKVLTVHTAGCAVGDSWEVWVCGRHQLTPSPELLGDWDVSSPSPGDGTITRYVFNYMGESTAIDRTVFQKQASV